MIPQSIFPGIIFFVCCALGLHAQSPRTGAGIASFPGSIPATVQVAWPTDPSFAFSIEQFDLIHRELQPDNSVSRFGGGLRYGLAESVPVPAGWFS